MENVGKDLWTFDDSKQLMSTGCTLSDYIDHSMAEAVYKKLDGGSFAGKIPLCKGAVAFGITLVECQHLLHATFKDWVFFGLKIGHPFPVLSGIGLNKGPAREPLVAV